VRTLKINRLVGSMDRVSAAGDYAAMESLFSILQKNMLDTQRWQIREDLQLAVLTWIEAKHDRQHRKRSRDKLTSLEFETINATRKVA
jgi:putative transposase